MQYHEIESRFRAAYNGNLNFMTPYVIEYGKKGPLIWELSHGGGLEPGTSIYGVTVIELPQTKRHDLCQAFSTQNDAEKYIATLNKS